MGYQAKRYRNEDLDDRQKLAALSEFRNLLEKYGVHPAPPEATEYKKDPTKLKNQVKRDRSYHGPLVLTYGVVQRVLAEDYSLCSFSELVDRVYEYEIVQGSHNQVEELLRNLLKDFPYGFPYYASKYNTLSWLYFRKFLMSI